MTLPDPLASRAVLVGTSKYDHQSDLPAVENNLSKLAELFTDKQFCGLLDQNCIVVSNPKTGPELIDPIADAAEEATDMLIVYFAGHGMPHSTGHELCLGLVGSKSGRMYQWVSYSDIQTEIRESRARRKLVILDCCYSGRATAGIMGDEDLTGQIANSANLPGVYLMASTASNKTSQSGDIFTAFTGELIALIQNGMPKCGDLLSVDDLFAGTIEALFGKGLPLPQKREKDHGAGFHLFRNVIVDTGSSIRYGNVPGVAARTLYDSRMALHRAGVHRPLQAGICGTADKGGAESIVVSGGYKDDKDYGNTIIYTGHGGRDPNTGAQVKDQSPEDTGNAALIKSMTTGMPVRVIRGSGGNPYFSPSSGYSYDGLFRVTDYSMHPSKDGPQVILFRLEYFGDVNTVDTSGDGGSDRMLGEFERLSSGVYAKRSRAEEIKRIYDYACQVCGTTLEIPGRLRVASVVYIRGLEPPHRGGDSFNNMLCLCSNHRDLFHFGAIVISDEHIVLDQVDGEEVGKLTVRHEIDIANIRYHRARHQFFDGD